MSFCITSQHIFFFSTKSPIFKEIWAIKTIWHQNLNNLARFAFGLQGGIRVGNDQIASRTTHESARQ